MASLLAALVGLASVVTARAEFAVQVGAFAREDEARTLVQSLATEGLPVYLAYGRPAQVLVGAYPTREEAEQMALRIRLEERLVCRVLEVGSWEPLRLGLPAVAGGVRTPARGRGTPANGDLREEKSRGQYDRLISLALEQMGRPYRYGGEDIEEGLDCSFFVQTVYRGMGVALPRTSGLQFRSGHRVTRQDLTIGDLVFFKRPGRRRVSHVGIYIGGGEFIHANRGEKKVTISRLDEPLFKRRYAGARRILDHGGS